MKDNRALAPWIKHFLLVYLPADRNFARNTQHSYREAIRTPRLSFVASCCRIDCDIVHFSCAGTDGMGPDICQAVFSNTDLGS